MMRAAFAIAFIVYCGAVSDSDIASDTNDCPDMIDAADSYDIA